VPIFEGGALRANYRGATAQIDTAVDAYNAQVLTAVREAADALSAIRTAEADAAEQRNVLASLSDTVRLDATRVRTGLGSRLDAIASGERLLQARQAQVNIDADAAVRRVQLLVALGGDFDPMGGQSAANTVSAGARP
jgi:outer membrane protein TolC